MKKTIAAIVLLVLVCFAFSGCSTIDNKSTSGSVIYAVMVMLSFLLLLGYCFFIKKREPWFVLLFSSVLIANAGYFVLSISANLEEALLANRISYLGSVFLPMAMFMIISNVSGVVYKKWISALLIFISIGVFFVAASPGYLDIYYKSVAFERVNGVSVLVKEYGSWHCLYLFYLLGYFLSMIYLTVRAITKKRVSSGIHSAVLIIAVASNIGVWLLEQITKVDFEFLSVSYIISEMFLFGLYIMIQNQEKQIDALQSQIENLKTNTNPVNQTYEKSESQESEEFTQCCAFLKEHISDLTATERVIYDFYLKGKGTKEIMSELNISENTLKYHNKNIYGKLGVSSRKQLVKYSKALKEE
ncbi:MAG: hypothetical protein II998_06150 [Clostridia bacterium]|nr:hypothetical protein [Clostridia bacterium]